MALGNLAAAGYVGHLVARINAGQTQQQLQAYLRAQEPGEHINSINAAINAARRAQAAAGFFNRYGQVSASLIPNPQGLGAGARQYHYQVLYTAQDQSGLLAGGSQYSIYSPVALTAADIESRLNAILALAPPIRVRGRQGSHTLGMLTLLDFSVLSVDFA